MTSAARWQRIEELCHAALARDPLGRPAFLTTACGSDEALRRDVEALLQHAPAADAFLATPMGALVASLLADDDAVSLVGRQIGAYEILSRLGAGGMGEVYRARDPWLGREVAIKVLPRAHQKATSSHRRRRPRGRC
jgi:serine/threonine protein kinase